MSEQGTNTDKAGRGRKHALVLADPVNRFVVAPLLVFDLLN